MVLVVTLKSKPLLFKSTLILTNGISYVKFSCIYRLGFMDKIYLF